MDVHERRRTRQENLARIGAKGNRAIIPLVTNINSTENFKNGEPLAKKPAIDKEISSREGSKISFNAISVHKVEKTEKAHNEKILSEPIYDMASSYSEADVTVMEQPIENSQIINSNFTKVPSTTSIPSATTFNSRQQKEDHMAIPRSASVSTPSQSMDSGNTTGEARNRSKTHGCQDLRKRLTSSYEEVEASGCVTPRKEAPTPSVSHTDGNIVCSTPRSKEMYARLLDGSKNMIEALKNTSPSRAVTALHEKIISEQSLQALETESNAAEKNAFTRTINISGITIPMNWMLLEQNHHSHKKRNLYHIFATMKFGSSVLATCVQQADGSREESRLIFPEKLVFDHVPSDAELEVRIFSFATEKKDHSGSTTPGRLVKEVTTPIKAKASEMRNKILKLIHPSKSQESLGLTPKKQLSGNFDFQQIGKATFKLSQLSKGITQHFTRIDSESDPSPVGNIISMTTTIIKPSEQEFNKEGTLTYWDEAPGRMGEWIRCKAKLGDNILRFFKETEGENTERHPLAQFELSNTVDATVSKVPKTECARPNSFVMHSTKGDVVLKASADSKDERDRWTDILSRNLFDLKSWVL